jgi:hypothetical protein
MTSPEIKCEYLHHRPLFQVPIHPPVEERRHQQVFLFEFTYKIQAVPLQAWTNPEGSRRLRLPYF